eukprot:646487-Pyramimonas_sp.AAC.1
MPSSEAKYYKGRSRGLRTVSVPLEAKIQENRFERASEVTYLWLSLRHLSKRRWDMGPIGPSDLPSCYRARRAQQLFEAASRLKVKFQEQAITMFDGTVFSNFWGEIGLQTELGYKFALVLKQ